MGSENGSSSWMVFQGSLIHSNWDKRLVVMENKVLGIHNGKIHFLEDKSEINRLQQEYAFSNASIHHLKANEFLIPGFIDTHIHAPQYVNVGGIGLGEPLLDWLQKHTYPAESGCKDLKFARNIFKKVVNRTLVNGSTTAVYYATIHLDASIALCDIIEEEGQRAFVGKVNIDNNSPEWYCETTESSVDDTQRFIENVIKRKNSLVQPIITPRFAVCCSEDLMKSLGRLAKNHQLSIQTHISENKEEVRLVESQFAHCSHYAGVYSEVGLLTERTILAHGVHLSDEEIDMIKQKGSGIAHCPTSNIGLLSGLCDVRRILDSEIPVGLGTDVSGGYSPCILDAMRQAIATSAIIAMSKNRNYKPIDYEDAFFLATLGGSQVIGLEKKIGNFEIGKDFDALLIDPTVSDGPIDHFADDDLKTRLRRFIYLGDDRNIKKVFVNGVQVKHR